MPRARFAAVLLPLTLALAGCSSSAPAADPAPAKAAEPAGSPGELLGVVDAGEGPAHLVTDTRGRFPVADTRGDAVLTFTADPLEQVAEFPLDGTPDGLAYDGTAQLLWATLTVTNEVVGLSTAGDELAEVARFPTVHQPNTVAVDGASGWSSTAAGPPGSCS
jgi:ABC-type Fe3+-hydroxamate transport system substrate-binding protein